MKNLAELRITLETNLQLYRQKELIIEQRIKDVEEYIAMIDALIKVQDVSP